MAKKRSQETSAGAIVALCNPLTLTQVVAEMLTDGCAVMFGQTRDGAKLIVTIYDGDDREKEYIEDVEELESFLNGYRKAV